MNKENYKSELNSFFKINIEEVLKKKSCLEFKIDEAFLSVCPSETLKTVDAHLYLEINSTAHQTIICQITIKGSILLVCDRSLEKFTHPLDIKKTHYLQLGDKFLEETYNVTCLKKLSGFFSLGQLIYDTLVLSLPMKKIHPKYEKEKQTLLYSTPMERPTFSDHVELKKLSKKIKI